MTQRKTYEVASFKALPDSDGITGRFEALVSVFNNVDVQGDTVMEGAFKNTIKSWRDSGDEVPVIWSHDWGNPFAHIGAVDPAKMRETSEGLVVEGTIDLTNPFAAQVYNLMKRRLVKEFSFGYEIVKEKEGKDRVNELHEVNIFELGPTLKGANPSTELLDVKTQLEDKAATKPWHIEKRGGQFCVIKDDDGDVEGCHDTRADAQAQMRALYANESSTNPEAKDMTINLEELVGLGEKFIEMGQTLVDLGAKSEEDSGAEDEGTVEEATGEESATEAEAGDGKAIEDEDAKLKARLAELSL